MTDTKYQEKNYVEQLEQLKSYRITFPKSKGELESMVEGGKNEN
jgi:hypothetical protein